MMQILEFIAANYAWFLGGTIVILLAIIGYVADKTNFGQGKNSETEEKNIDLNRLNSMGIDQLYTENIEKENIQQQLETPINNEQIEFETSSSDDQIEISQNINNEMSSAYTDQDYGTESVELANDIENSIDNQTNQIDSSLSSFIASTESLNKKVIGEIKNSVEVETSIDSILSEESFNNFNKEFDTLLPEKEVIDTDLLTDIDDLEFDKTQKLDLNDISSLSDIELPNIKRVNKEEHDIWKF